MKEKEERKTSNTLLRAAVNEYGLFNISDFVLAELSTTLLSIEHHSRLSSVREESLRFTAVCLVSFGSTGELTDSGLETKRSVIKIMRLQTQQTEILKRFLLPLIIRFYHSMTYPFCCKCQCSQTNFPFTLYLIHLVALKTIQSNPPPLPLGTLA